ncbi:MAG: MFS transporter [Rhodopseudomonas sp.]|nr:MFS transporter [Rhodopseudomonas sp.]
MNMTYAPRAAVRQAATLPPWLTLLLATAAGLIAANVYYAQPLVGAISAALGMSPQATGLIVTMTQIGYGAGLLLVVPLGDLVENRRLIVIILAIATLALIGAAVSSHVAGFLTAALLIGVGAVAVQVLVPYVAHLAPEQARGRVVGNVMSGLMLGIMLARPAASVVADLWSWHGVFVISAVLMAGLAVVLRLALPKRQPAPGLSYIALLASMVRLALHTPVLQRRALYQACLFGAFSLFWTTVPLLLADTFGMSQRGIALFALAGVAGAIAAPLAGRAADRGWSKAGTGVAMITVSLSLLLGWFGLSGSYAGLAALVAAAVLLDFGVTGHFVLGQRAIFSLPAAYRGRLNGLYMATFFTGGAIGSALGGWTYAEGGWPLSMAVGAALPLLAFVGYLVNPSAAEVEGSAP